MKNRVFVLDPENTRIGGRDLKKALLQVEVPDSAEIRMPGRLTFKSNDSPGAGYHQTNEAKNRNQPFFHGLIFLL